VLRIAGTQRVNVDEAERRGEVKVEEEEGKNEKREKGMAKDNDKYAN
jgi:hypothetical protein